jgi:uncharacterized protein (TIGR00251 family)
MPVRAHGDDLELEVLVVPRASRARIGPVVGGRLKIAVTSPPVDGAANHALVALLAERLGVPTRAVEVVRGGTGRRKTVRVHGIAMALAVRALEGVVE